jgi:hypothetical protein
MNADKHGYEKEKKVEELKSYRVAELKRDPSARCPQATGRTPREDIAGTFSARC